MNRILVVLLMTLLGIHVIRVDASAGVTGKIVGIIKDNKTGESLPGVSVTIGDTRLGAVTDKNGRYLILNIPPGTYSLRAKLIGYLSLTMERVLVITDLTTTIDVRLDQTVLDLGEETVVIAERPLVQQDITAKMSIVTKDQIDRMPVENLTDIIATLPGYTDASHLRGGRGNEVAYMIDGMYISDPLTSTFEDLQIDKDFVQELIVMSGAFNAEYGKAMSGVVNIVTIDPTSEYHGKLEYLSPMLNKSPYRTYRVVNGQSINAGTAVADLPPGRQGEYRYRSLSLSDFYDRWDIQAFRGQLRASLSGGVPLVHDLTFFLAGRYLNEDIYLPFGYNLEREAMGKLVYKFSPNIKLSFMTKLTQDGYQPYSHSFKYRPEHSSIYDRSSIFHSMVFSHAVNEKTFYTVRASYYDQMYNRQVRDRYVDIASLRAREAGDTSAVVNTNYERPDSWAGEFNYIGDDVYYLDDETSTLGIMAEITSQIDAHHLMKAGGEVTKHNVDRMWFQEAWIGGNHEYQKYTRKPLELAAYLQDKIEFEFLIINLGVRFDYFDPKATMFPNIFNPGYIDENNKFHYYPEVSTPAQWMISPRIGLAHPVSENLVFHFAYGHFFQRPDYQDMYYLHDILRVLSVIGNPTMKPQRTQAFEFGVKQQIGKLFAIDFSLYYKDIFNLSGSSFQFYYPHNYAVYDNSDYANVKGFEITLQKRYSHYVSGNFNYTWLIAQGNENSAREGATRYWGSTENRLRPTRTFPLNWDRRHTISMNVDFSIPEGEGPSLFGLKLLGNTSANFIAQVKSGLPYTPQAIVHPEFDRSTIQNSARMPWTYRVDMRLAKMLKFNGMNCTAYLKITNIFNTKNVQSIYALTGKPWDAGPTSNLSQDFQRDPTAYEAPRQIYVGVGIGL